MTEQIYKTQKCICGHLHSRHVTFFYREMGKHITYCQGDDKIPKCICTKFQVADQFSQLLTDIDKYMAKMEKMADKVQWVLLNLKFFRNYSDKYVHFAWWYYVNHWDMWHDQLTPSMYVKLDDGNDVCRARRIWREKDRKDGTNLYLPFKPNVEEEHIYRQYQLEEFFIGRKSNWK